MKIIKQNIIQIIAGLVLIILSVFYFSNQSRPIQKAKVDIPIEITEEPKPDIVKKEIKKEVPVFLKENSESFVRVDTPDKSYKVNIEGGENVYEVMNNLKNDKNNNFDFKYREYSSLGIFIKEINGVKDGGGKYWFYYINGVEASMGVSNYIIKKGETISWKLK